MHHRRRILHCHLSSVTRPHALRNGTGEPAANPGVMLINVAGGGTWFPRMLEWADMQWQWRNPYTGACA